MEANGTNAPKSPREGSGALGGSVQPGVAHPPSLSDVARMAGVSLTTASMVLNKGKQINRVSASCAQRIRTVAESLGYIANYHARSMKLGRAEVIAVALDMGHLEPDQPASRPQLGISYFGAMIGGIEVATRNAGYQMTIVGPDLQARAPDRGLLGIRQRRFDGLIVPGLVVHSEHSHVIEDAPDANIVIIEFRGSTELPVVDFNDAVGVQMAVRYLAELGHRDLLWVGEPQTEEQVLVAPRREQAFMTAVWDAGLRGSSCRPPFKYTPAQRPARTKIIDDVADALAPILKSPAPRKFTAVVCYSDRVALGVCSALLQAGIRIPQDVSVIGFDDVEAELCIPRLTTVSHKLPQMGARATELLFEMIRSPGARKQLRGTRHWIEPEIVIRKSTAPPPAT